MMISVTRLCSMLHWLANMESVYNAFTAKCFCSMNFCEIILKFHHDEDEYLIVSREPGAITGSAAVPRSTLVSSIFFRGKYSSSAGSRRASCQ